MDFRYNWEESSEEFPWSQYTIRFIDLKLTVEIVKMANRICCKLQLHFTFIKSKLNIWVFCLKTIRSVFKINVWNSFFFWQLLQYECYQFRISFQNSLLCCSQLFNLSFFRKRKHLLQLNEALFPTSLSGLHSWGIPNIYFLQWIITDFTKILGILPKSQILIPHALLQHHGFAFMEL